MTIFHALILGIIEGLTEFFPVSSTGHLIIAEKLLHISEPPLFFNLIIQSGSILALLVYFRNELKQVLLLQGKEKRTEFILKMGIATAPALVLGFLLHDNIELMQQSVGIVAFMSIAVALAMDQIEKRFASNLDKNKPEEKQTFLDYLMIGMYQAVSIIPGVSRSGATVIGGITRKFSFEQSVQTAFLMGIPIMGAATAYETLKFLSQVPTVQSLYLLPTLVGFIVSFFVSLLTIKWTLPLFKTYGFKPFIIYRIGLGFLLAILLLLKIV
jgi:undecaprenyl-diphosphatase